MRGGEEENVEYLMEDRRYAALRGGGNSASFAMAPVILVELWRDGGQQHPLQSTTTHSVGVPKRWTKNEAARSSAMLCSR